MKIFISTCAVLLLLLALVFFGTVYCAETVDMTLSAIDELESPSTFSPEKAEEIYRTFEKRAFALRYFIVSNYIEEVLLPLSNLRYVPIDDTLAQKSLIEEARIKLDKLRVAGTFSFAAII